MTGYRRNSILNLLFNYSNVLFGLITGVFLVPYYLRHLTLDAYGSFLAATGIAGLVGLLEFGLSMVLTQRLATAFAQSNWNAFRQTLHTGVLAATLLFTVTCVTTLALVPVLPMLTMISATYRGDLTAAFLLLGFAAGANIFLNFFGAVFQALLRSGTLGAANLVSAIVGVTVVIVAFGQLHTLTSIALGTFARVLVATSLLSIAAWYTLRSSTLTPLPAPARDSVALLRTCAPICIGGISRAVAENSQNILVANALSPASIAVLALTQKAFQVCSMVLAPIGSSIYSNLTQLKEKSSKEYFASLLGISIRGHFILSIILVATALAWNPSFVSLWVGSEKFGGPALSFLTGLAVLLTARFTFFGFLIYSTGDFKKPLVLETGYSATKIALLLMLVPNFGLIAVPLADLAAGAVFLYTMSGRAMEPHLRRSPFKAGLYTGGWLLFAVLASLGHALAWWKGPGHGWLGLAGNALLFLALATLVGCLLHARFIGQALRLNREHRSATS